MPTTDIEDHNDIQLADGVTAYHGSPHEFEEFDPAFIGTGEGAQAYGHGLYFAENEGVAKDYRNKLAPPKVDTGYHNINSVLANVYGGDWEAFKADNPKPSEALAKAIAEIDARGGPKVERAGHMYEVKIDAHPEEHILDWDKPLSEQNTLINKVYNSLGGKHKVDQLNSEYDKLMDMTLDERSKLSKEKYKELENRFNELQSHPAIRLQQTLTNNPDVSGKNFYYRFGGDKPELASKDMASIGVRGIKYLDQGSRTASEEPTHNYVIFDPKHIKVKRRYAEGGGIKAFAIGNSIPHLERASDMIETHDDIQLAPGVEPVNNSSQLTDTPAFKKWFSGSKVVDEKGNPLRLYHGTTVWKRDDGRNLGDFNEFDRMASVKQVRRPQWLDTIGSWFSDNPGERGAGLYAGDEEGGTIYPVHLNIKNPLKTDFDWLLNKAKELGPTIVDKFQSTPRKKYYKAAPEAYEKLHHWIKKQGYDGVIIPKGSAKEFEHQNVYIALHPTQIKSATGNIGDFDPENPDITKNSGGIVEKPAKAYGGAIIPGPKLTEDNADDFARRLIAWTFATAPLFQRASGGSVINDALDVVSKLRR